jgi:hypothetical protein
MKLVLSVWFCLATLTVKSQQNACEGEGRDSATRIVKRTEIMTSGILDLVNTGSISASSRLIRLHVGDPDGFSIPLSVYSGVSSNNFQNQLISGYGSNRDLFFSLINPLSGMANISTEGLLSFGKNRPSITSSGLVYQAGIRIITGFSGGLILDPAFGSPVNFLNAVSVAGLHIRTGAWERNNRDNIGVFWLTGRFIVSKSGSKDIQRIFPAIVTDGLYHGWSLAWGLEINDLLNARVVYYKYLRPPDNEFNIPIYQLSFNYSLK